MPEPGRRTLVGVGGVQGLDGERHRHRKAMLLSLLSDERRADLLELIAGEWAAALPGWRRQARVVLADELPPILCRAVCQWAGVPLPVDEVTKRTGQLQAMIDGPLSVGPRHWAARRARREAEGWLVELVTAVRDGSVTPSSGSALAVVAAHREPDGQPLDARVAAVELLNLLRSTVAVERYVVFAAHALHHHPELRARLVDGDLDPVDFGHEVRRRYPFFPAVAAVATQPFTWRGEVVRRGDRALLDLYGTNHDPRVWADPYRFDPDRFAGAMPDPYAFVPQGGGDTATGHRCAGEALTAQILALAVGTLACSMSYRVPPQDLRISLARVPTRPASGFVLTHVEVHAPVTVDLSRRR
ncbi:cytochrome P450 [Luedemannella flava]